LTYKQALAKEVDIKTQFTKLVNICSGAVQASQDEQQKAMAEIFDTILSFRSSKRINGRFMNYELEERVRRLEEGLSVTNNFVEQLIEYLYKERTGK
jgi:hypothetical protein